MNILIKNALKNTFGKPFRTILVILTIFVCSLAAMMCFDLSGAMKTVMLDDVRSISNADYQVIVKPGQPEQMPEGFPEAEVMPIYLYGEKIYVDIPGEYNYVKMQTLRVLGVDFGQAAQMEFIEAIEIGYMEAAVTYKFAQRHGYSEGDTIVLHDKANEPHEFTIAKILPGSIRNPLIATDSALVNLESAEVLSCGQDNYGLFMIDILDNDQAEEAKQMLIDVYGDASVEDFIVPEEVLEETSNLASVLTLVFVITFLLVIFVTYSICERIVSERMSLVGTLRSLGMNSKRTAKILLLENVLYALFGSIPAVLLYTLIRNPMMTSLLAEEYADGSTSTPDFPPMYVLMLVSVVLGAVLIECLIPLRAILKAMNISIRDIIFDNRDTEYKFSKPAIITGIILLAVASVLFFFRSVLSLATICMICSVTGLALVFPLLFKVFAGLMKKAADKKEDAGWQLALTETISRKSTVSSGMLCATSAAMCVIIFAIAASAINTFTATVYKGDVLVHCTDKPVKYSFIKYLDGATDIEKVYCTTDKLIIGDSTDDRLCQVSGVPDGGYEYYDMFRGLPEKIDDGTVYFHSSLQSKYGLKEGDKITIVFNSDHVLPIKKEMIFGGTFDTVSSNDGKNMIVLSQDDYIRIFHDVPDMLMVNAADPELVAATINKYTSSEDTAQTRIELEEEDRRDAASSVAVFTAVFGVAIGMTAVGMISNQLIGFEGRKKELAVMLSTAMNVKTLSGILILEILTMSGFASLMGTLFGALITVVLKTGIAGMEGVFFDLEINPLMLLIMWIVTTLIYTLTVLFPISKMKKMKISEQIKYE